MRKRDGENIILTLLVLCITLNLFAFSRCYGIAYVAASIKKASEYEIKAVYLYYFLLFAKWPESESESGDNVGDLCIGIVGKDPFGDSFADIEGEVIKSLNQRLVIVRYGSYKKGLELGRCRLLFVCDSERSRLTDIVQELKGSRTLTIADSDGFLKYGGMINLVKVGKKIRWEINRTPVKKANIQLSSQLLRSAVKIVEIPKQSEKEIARRAAP